MLNDADTNTLLNVRLCVSQATLFNYVMRRQKLAHIVTTGMMEKKHRMSTRKGLGHMHKKAGCRTCFMEKDMITSTAPDTLKMYLERK